MTQKFKWEFKKNKNNFAKDNKDLSELLKGLISQIDIKSKEDIQKFLKPDVSELHSHKLLYKIDTVVQNIFKAIENNQKIVIHGDFDVDGVVATSILWDYLYRKLGADVIPVIPNRFNEGYGLTDNSIKRMKNLGADLIITVDCGIKDLEMVKKHKELDFIITDHHSYPVDENDKKLDLKAENLKGIVHPQHPDGKYPFVEICGGTVSWKLIQALDEYNKEKKVVESCLDFDPNTYLELVAISTVTDVMPLIDENRTIVFEGLKQMRETKNVSLEALFERLDIQKTKADTYYFGYIIGPRINAAGRMEDAIHAVKFLSTENKDNAFKLFDQLNEFNIKRQSISTELFEKAKDQIKSFDKDQKLFFIYGEDWPEGILGLVAGKINEKYNRPTLVASINTENNTVKGSARSPKAFDVTKALRRQTDLLEKFGGHVQAAGFTLKKENLEKFIKNLVDDANERLTPKDLVPVLTINSKLDLDKVNIETIEEIDSLAPFGVGNSRPKFLFENIELLDIQTMGKENKHIRLQFETDKSSIRGIGFNCAENFKDVKKGDHIDLVGSIKINEWKNNRYPQIEIIDFKKL